MGRLGLAAQFIDQRNAIFLVEMEIGEDHVDLAIGDVIGAKRLGAAQRHMGRAAPAVEQMLHAVEDCRFIIDHQNRRRDAQPRRAGAPCSCRGRAEW